MQKSGKGDDKTSFYTDSRKLAIFSTLSFGIYYVYWFYRNWKLINLVGKKKYSAFWRTVSLIVPILNLYQAAVQFEEIKQLAIEEDFKLSYSVTFCILFYLFLSALWQLPGYYSYLGALSFLPLLPVQKAVNRIATQEKEEKMTFSVKEVFLLIVLGFIFILSIFYR